MSAKFSPIGYVRTRPGRVPRSWTSSDVEGVLEVLPEYAEGLRDIRTGESILVVFHFHQSPPFEPGHLRQTPPHREGPVGVFSTCSPLRPNPVGVSVLEVLGVEGGSVRVRGLDMLDGTPILDIKPHVAADPSHPCRRDGP
ncbi:tRNA (N6-threonylcarbamoyladenosine(37)-N6)-methyltransferase TrmO [Rubrobacter xylanophilus]|uniref:tRNA (N6-threonylcarbamoyladenosine(37)-N6)-methyltransferase TrmO n=1 Tax=Rubrobacter xylanophilus TaxID=49319 RepID=A0A510HM87_9ACTN|nr:tRNA (N6-threonylcarbamoyladenosine(37)-N6)-methyltransferase TrmO [Rubrobacter xylanophilus]BBL81102.1 tRNA (N6-threonylcarbamoyladenosine(37)-N6)-methyltransferase TrmO [Rubrobacter xylanophilus]